MAAAGLAAARGKLIDELLESIPGNFEVSLSDNSEQLAEKFVKVVDGLQTLAELKAAELQASGKSFFDVFGSKLAGECNELRQTRTSEPVAPRRRAEDVCFFVPSRYSDNMQVNDEPNLKVVAGDLVTAFGMRLAKKLGVVSTKLVVSPEFPKERVIASFLARYEEKYGNVRGFLEVRRAKKKFIAELKQLCGQKADVRSSLVWMAEAGYPLDGAKKEEVISITNTCDCVFNVVGIDYLEKVLDSHEATPVG